MSYILSGATGASNEAYQILLTLSILVMSGFIFGKIAQKLKFPAITGYIVIGLILGPHMLGDAFPDSAVTFTSSELSSLAILSDIALGFIGFHIGLELFIPTLKKSGKSVFIITIMQALFTYAIVFVVVLLVSGELWLSFIISAIAIATAPASCMMIIKKYNCKGPVTSKIIPLVGIDDAIGIIVFGISLSLGVVFYSTGAELSINSALIHPLGEIVKSALFGAAIGTVMALAYKFLFQNSEKKESLLDVSILLVFISVVAAKELGLSLILVTMVFGFVFTNTIDKESYELEETVLDGLVPPIMIAFFVLTGTKLDLRVFLDLDFAVLMIAYVIARVVGKILGSYVGAVVTDSPDEVRKYLGTSLIPQEGVAIAFAAQAALVLDADAGLMVQQIILGAVLINCIIGPVLVKWSLTKAGEVRVFE